MPVFHNLLKREGNGSRQIQTWILLCSSRAPYHPTQPVPVPVSPCHHFVCEIRSAERAWDELVGGEFMNGCHLPHQMRLWIQWVSAFVLVQVYAMATIFTPGTVYKYLCITIWKMWYVFVYNAVCIPSLCIILFFRWVVVSFLRLSAVSGNLWK